MEQENSKDIAQYNQVYGACDGIFYRQCINLAVFQFTPHATPHALHMRLLIYQSLYCLWL